jgi:hypothetical protein
LHVGQSQILMSVTALALGHVFLRCQAFARALVRSRQVICGSAAVYRHCGLAASRLKQYLLLCRAIESAPRVQ